MIIEAAGGVSLIYISLIAIYRVLELKVLEDNSKLGEQLRTVRMPEQKFGNFKRNGMGMIFFLLYLYCSPSQLPVQ